MPKLHAIERLTTIQYNAIMMAISAGYDAIDENTFIDPYTENLDGYTNETLGQALKEVERIIMISNVPF